MKALIKKSVVPTVVITALILIMSTLPSLAANRYVHIVMGLGRNVAVRELPSGEVKAELIDEDVSSSQSLFRGPISEDDTVYVPMRYVLQSVGMSVLWDSETSAITIATGDEFQVWSLDSSKNVVSTKVYSVEYKNGVFTGYNAKGVAVVRMESEEPRTYFGKTYIEASELERFGFIVQLDADEGIIHYYSGTDDDFTTAFKEIFKETNSLNKETKVSNYMESIRQSTKFMAAYTQYFDDGVNNNNNVNNSLVLNSSGGRFMANPNGDTETESRNITVLSNKSIQLCYAELGGQQYVYSVGSEDGQIYRMNLASGRLLHTGKIELPEELEGKQFTQLSVVADRLFFVAYDMAQYGGYVYMAQVGSEGTTAVRVTSGRAWNLHVSSDFVLYYADMENNCYLSAIDLKDTQTLLKLAGGDLLGVKGSCVLEDGVQSIAFSKESPDTFYYSSISNRAIYRGKISNGTVKTEKLISAPNASCLQTFLNIYETSGERFLYYIEYDDGVSGNLTGSRVKKYDVYEKTSETVVETDKVLIELSIMDEDIYCTDLDYSAIYKLELKGESTYTESFEFSQMKGKEQ